MDNTQLLIKQSIQERISRISRLSVHNLTTAIFFIRENWKSGMSQALMNIPFYLNAANNSGDDPAKGLWSGFIGAMVNGFLSGSNHSIYAPTWVTAPDNYYLLQIYGPEVIPWVTLIIGLQIFIISKFNWHHLLNFMPYYVIEGYYLGIAFIVMNGYIDYGFGLTDMHANRGRSVYADRIEMYIEYFRRGDLQFLLQSIAIFFLLYIGNKLDNTKPWIILTSFFGLMMGQLFPTERCLKSVYGNVKFQMSHIKQEGPYFQPDIQLLGYLFTYAIPMTIYITLQNFICAKGTDFQASAKYDIDQEMFCVAVSNISSGVFGGLPVCASLRMYFLNVKLLTNNKWSSIISAFSILLIYGILGDFFLQIPLYVISGHLLYSAYLNPTWSYLEMLVRTKRRAVLTKLMIICLLCIYYGALESTIIGVVYAMFQFVETNSVASSEVIIDNEEAIQQRISIVTQNKQSVQVKVTHQAYDDRLSIAHSRALYRFNGSINYINIKNHVKQIKQLPHVENIILSFRYVSSFDDEAIDKLAILTSNMIKSDRIIFITGLRKSMVEQICYNEFFKQYMQDYPHRFKALENI